MRSQDRELAENNCLVSEPRLVNLTSAFPRLVLQHIAHELGLQFLGAALAANMHRTFLYGQFLVPGRQMHYGNVVIVK